VNPDIAGSSRQSLGSVANVTGAAPTGFCRLAIGVEVVSLQSPKGSPHLPAPLAAYLLVSFTASPGIDCGTVNEEPRWHI
jgi:hypothetical protein